jgi:acyl-CoA reductase-like NAD-dependent aldehyde dehydrogenase
MKSINPATEQVLAEYPQHTPDQIDRTLTAASTQFARWRETPSENRAALFRSLARVLRARQSELAILMTSEMGKPIAASESEVEKCALCCEYFARSAAQFLSPRAIASDASRSFVRFDPLGPVLAIMPWNFPLWQVFRAAVPALMAGNVMVLKHAANVPGCSLAIESVFTESGFPPHVFAALLIEDNQTAQSLVDHPAIVAVTLTGSERAGSAVSSSAGKALKKTVMELGGSDAFIVLADADISAVAAAAAEARCVNNGQSCIAAKRFIVEEPIADAFEEAFTAAMAAMKLGDPMDRASKIGPLARLDLLETLHAQVRKSIEEGAVPRTGGRRKPGIGFFYEPTVLTRVKPGMTAFDEETFGPVAAVVRARDPRDAVRLANQSRFGLGASIWTKNLDRAQNLAGEIEAGAVFINGVVKSDPRLPFGGVKHSGWGRELSEFGITEFVNIKTVWMK